MSVECSPDIEFDGTDNITVFNSSEWAERGFCNKCGSNLYYRLKGNGVYYVLAGLFEDQSKFNFDHQVFIDEKPSYYDFKNETHNMTGAEVFALNAPPPD